jgi:hypothetical protein
LVNRDIRYLLDARLWNAQPPENLLRIAVIREVIRIVQIDAEGFERHFRVKDFGVFHVPDVHVDERLKPLFNPCGEDVTRIRSLQRLMINIRKLSPHEFEASLDSIAKVRGIEVDGIEQLNSVDNVA